MSRRKSPVMREGLADLLGASADLARAPTSERTLPVEALRPGAGQPRRSFDQQTLTELAESIRTRGVLQPLLVRPVSGGHEIVAGERRWRAAQLAGLSEVPVMIRELSDQEARQIALIENLQREDLNMLDEVDAKLELVASTLGLPAGQARSRLMQLLREPPNEDHVALEELFASLGESWSNFAKTKLRVLNWPPTILDAIRAGLPYTLGGVIASAPVEAQARLLELARQGASRHELRTELRRLQAAQAQERPRLQQVGRVLSNRQWAASLSAQEQRELEKWLSRMPSALQRALG
ncbi:chromosome partitioning protein, ParB family [Deinococcus reticulitermitis]|uniref:Chromosome partitioning protein, ParB family n=1 Tax=Deinococcus reticulitermitis TaxID=856736 RepID=A0A1H7CEB1_9DEIO|nr:ParB/RepB/Spo0J family partition protein [Deinococcus reticulitermitis]SEJ83995.1 chromosome partitioning protein, ParB family [Deinococcus reticulitermitis]